MEKIKVDYTYVFPFIKEEDIEKELGKAIDALNTLLNKKGKGKEFLGWIDLPEKMLEKKQMEGILEVANEIKENADLLICIGIGGSYLGAKAVTEALFHPFHNLLSSEKRVGPKLLFAGQNISALYLEAILEQIKDNRSVYVNVISKSGTTTEPGIAFRLIKEAMEKKYGKKEAQKRIIATTDAKKGALRELATVENYRTFAIPDDVGGRYSVFTAVGLLPIASVGLDIKRLLEGALFIKEYVLKDDFLINPALVYATIRNILLKKGYNVEILVTYEPNLHYISEWWKQLFGESEGKENKGIFPASVDFTTDLHSMGQWIQEGQRFIFETVLNVEETSSTLEVPSDKNCNDGLEYLAGKTYFEINKMALLGTVIAHHEGGVPNIIFNIPYLSESNLGQLLYTFEISCGISGYILGVNPFDQPGVEMYKKNMFALLNKPGEEKNKKILGEKIQKFKVKKITE